MLSLNFHRISRAVAVLVATAACAVSMPALAAISVTYLGIDSDTGGDYRDADYGNCFSVISQASPRAQIPEVEVGPGLYTEGDYLNLCSDDMVGPAGNRPENVSNCTEAGVLIPARAGIDSAVCVTERGAPTMAPSDFDFRFYKDENGPDTLPVVEGPAFAWSFLEPNFNGANEPFEVTEWNDPVIYDPPVLGLPNRPASQFNACLTANQPAGSDDIFRAGTFDNGEFDFDPLAGVVRIYGGGKATVAYYFLTAALADCRQQDWTITVAELDSSGNPVLSTEQVLTRADLGGALIGDFIAGKYLVLELDGIPSDGAIVRLDAVDDSDFSCIYGVNSVISGIFVSGTDLCAAGLGDRVWEDLDLDGVQDDGEPDVDGATVRLYQDCDTNDEVLIGTASTVNGNYLFTDLVPGTYCVEFDLGTLPEDFCAFGDPQFTLQNQGNDTALDSDADPGTGRTANIELELGETDLTWDAGIYCPARLGNRVWLDVGPVPTGANGAQDDGEADVPGVTVNLYDCADLATVIDTAATDANGEYYFDVEPGCYRVGFVEPDGTNFTQLSPPGVGSPATDSDAHPLGDIGRPKGFTPEIEMESNELDETWDAGLVNVPDPQTPSIDIRKQEEGEDTRLVPYGGIVDFEIVVTNNGEVDLLNVVVTDPLLPQCDKDISQALIDAGGNPTGVFVVDAQFAYTCTDPMVTAGYRNVADVTGDPVTGPPPVTDSDPSSVEVIPETGGEGCTPGYWKQPHHFDSWTAPYTPDTLFSDVFEDAFPGMTLLDVVGQGGGGLKALGRHTVAALLNAASGGVSYDIGDPQGVIDGFNAVYPGSKRDYNGLKNEYEGFNEQGCPLN